VIAAVEGGEPVVLTVHGRPVADILPHQRRSERRPTELLLADLTRRRRARDAARRRFRRPRTSIST
jgi:prevent-host-death family protein